MVDAQESLIKKQRALVRQLQEAGEPDALALETLATMERTFEIFRQDLERLSRR